MSSANPGRTVSSSSIRERPSRSAVGAAAVASVVSTSSVGNTLHPSSAAASASAAATAASRSRHSLYGTDDRVILDLGSKVWKVGFSGESAPRAVFDVGSDVDDGSDEVSRQGELWNYDGLESSGSTSTGLSSKSKKVRERELERKLKRWLRRVYYECVHPEALLILKIQSNEWELLLIRVARSFQRADDRSESSEGYRAREPDAPDLGQADRRSDTVSTPFYPIPVLRFLTPVLPPLVGKGHRSGGGRRQLGDLHSTREPPTRPTSSTCGSRH